MAEWLKAHAWKACVGETLPWVRIPLSPPASSPAARSPAERVVPFAGRSSLCSDRPARIPLSHRGLTRSLAIDGREPDSATHAARILRSYAPGEEASVEIMRERRKQTLKVQMPDDR